jgi:ABC-2 type transport system ATP-binding protein
MSHAIIEARDLSFGYSRRDVLSGLNLSLAKGEWAVIAGPNGAGKSTLLRLLAGVLLPGSGTVVRSNEAAPAHTGFISDRLSLFEDWTVARAAGFHCRAFGIASFDDGLLRRIGIAEHARIRDLSAGERAIVHLSLALAQRPSLLLIDEVLHMLDPYVRDLFVGALIEAIAVQQAAVVTVNHTFSEIEKLPDRVLVMEGGSFAVDETAEALRSRVKKVVGRGPLPAALPCLFQRTEGGYTEHFVYPFQEGMRAPGLDFQDVSLPEIVKAFIGGGYEKKRMA